MSMQHEQQIMDVKAGAITGQFTQDKVILRAKYDEEEKDCVRDIELSIMDQQGRELSYIELEWVGYGIQLFVEDFTGDDQDEVMIRGWLVNPYESGVAIVYRYENGELIEIFNNAKWENDNDYKVEYLENKAIHVLSDKINKKYDMALNEIWDRYLQQQRIQKVEGIDRLEMSVKETTGVYPIQSTFSNQYELLIEQNLKVDTEVVAIIQSRIVFKEQQPKVVDQAILIKGEVINTMNRLEDEDILEEYNEQIVENLPKGAKLIEIEEGIMIVDLDQDGKPEWIVPYLQRGIAHIAVFKKVNNAFKMIDWIKGKGYSIKDFRIEQVSGKDNLIIGWMLEEKSIGFDMFELVNNQLQRAFYNKIPFYAKIDFEDLNGDGKKEVILWIHDTKGAYKIQIYKFVDRRLKQTNEYDKIYFPKVISYYQDLLRESPESGIYMYYLIDANLKIEAYKEALTIVKECESMSKPYPSLAKLHQIEKWIITKIKNKEDEL